MIKKTISCEIEVYESEKALQPNDKSLMQAAVEARDGSYAPYSKFNVGAALLLEDGIVVKGSNQENASYPSGLCAERVAIFAAGANYPNKKIMAIAISVASQLHLVDRPAAPCGNCRQAILEYEVKQQTPISILMQGAEGAVYKSESLGNLLPLSFDGSFLGDS
ncbi:cytidine deaminase [Flavobacterium sp. ASW18X]|uniref:cytidine deaminase n=1 Tax=Flavobacterium sp. ASW18X TaxID=2572595 RepID=UPI0010AEADB6|nr:cytidine deaminase [Flavobacterium sp. ASW18X]TKD59330.1 cytidine deaminase [Flavobacterium sp. ASW18X]